MKYCIDGRPVTSSELIAEAAELNERFANDWLKQTSVAANILRNHGCTVTENEQQSQQGVEG